MNIINTLNFVCNQKKHYNNKKFSKNMSFKFDNNTMLLLKKIS